METQKSRYSSPVDHRSLDDLCTNTYTMSQKLCARYTLGARYLSENTVYTVEVLNVVFGRGRLT